MDFFLFVTEEGFYGYKVGGVYQEFHPGYDGFVLMNGEEAEFWAKEIYCRLIGQSDGVEFPELYIV